MLSGVWVGSSVKQVLVMWVRQAILSARLGMQTSSSFYTFKVVRTALLLLVGSFFQQNLTCTSTTHCVDAAAHLHVGPKLDFGHSSQWDPQVPEVAFLLQGPFAVGFCSW